MCYGARGQILVGFPRGNPGIERLGYAVLEERHAQLLSEMVDTLRPDIAGSLSREVGLIEVPPGAEQRTIAEVQRDLVYRGMELFDHEPQLRGPLVEGFHRSNEPPFVIEPNAVMSTATPAAQAAGFVLDSGHDAAAVAMLGLGNAAGGGAGIRIGILDSGLDVAGAGAWNLVAQLNVMDWQDPQLRGDVTDGHGHGTQLAAIIARHAPSADYTIVRVADDSGCTTTFHLIAGLCVASDCSVLNVSIASSPHAQATTCGPLSDELVSGNLAAIVRGVCSEDAVVVAAAGNKALDHLAYPARVADSIAVVSINSQKRLSAFSNHGTEDHEGNPHLSVFAAPGGDEAPDGTVSEAVGTDGGGTTKFVGTSYATAYATALVALYRGMNPASDRGQTIDALTRDADDSFSGYDPQLHGNGVLQLM